MQASGGPPWTGMGREREQEMEFYAYNGLIAGRNTILVQGNLPTLVRVFEWVGLYAKPRKTKPITCIPGFILGHTFSISV